MVNNFLFELGSEELPSAAVPKLGMALATLLQAELEKLHLTFSAINFFATPRRIAVLVSDLLLEQPPQSTVKRGPALTAAFNELGAPTPALQGFAKSCAVDVDQLTVLKTDKGEWMVYEQTTEGVKTKDSLPKILTQVLAALPITKPMRWGDGNDEYARPVQWIVMLLGHELIPYNFYGLATQAETYGHRFLAPNTVTITNPLQYELLLNDNKVIGGFEKRRQLIRTQINELATRINAVAVVPENLLEEVTSIVEWPEALIAKFDEKFLEVPAEALIASMQTHQKCFALRDHNGNLLPHFITISNLKSKNPAQVIHGNEKVMRARLSDAAFFFQQDKKHTLSSRITETANVIFQVKLGSLNDKAERLSQLMTYFSPLLNLNADEAKRAAELSKCDLMTGMVSEFPELQGLMGEYYALHDNESPAVAKAIYEQYLPRFANDELPTSLIGMALSLSDRLDTLVGIFAIGQKPTGDKDPYKLRRHALAIVRLLIKIEKPLDLSELITQSIATYSFLTINDNLASELHAFILDRLQSWYQSANFSADLVHSVRAVQTNKLHDFDNRIKALANFITLPAAASLSSACKRVNNLLQAPLKQHELIQEHLLTAPAEKALYLAINQAEQTLHGLYEQGQYDVILEKLALLRPVVDNFFDKVMVMVDDTAIKSNRLSLLCRLQQLLKGTADISLLQLA